MDEQGDAAVATTSRVAGHVEAAVEFEAAGESQAAGESRAAGQFICTVSE